MINNKVQSAANSFEAIRDELNPTQSSFASTKSSFVPNNINQVETQADMRAFQKAKIKKAQDAELLKEVEKHAKNFAKLASEGTMSTLLPSRGIPDTEQASTFYQSISVIMKRYGFCINNFNEIHLTKSCIPRDWDVHPTMITNVKFALFKRIQAMIPLKIKNCIRC